MKLLVILNFFVVLQFTIVIFKKCIQGLKIGWKIRV